MASSGSHSKRALCFPAAPLNLPLMHRSSINNTRESCSTYFLLSHCFNVAKHPKGFWVGPASSCQGPAPEHGQGGLNVWAARPRWQMCPQLTPPPAPRQGALSSPHSHFQPSPPSHAVHTHFLPQLRKRSPSSEDQGTLLAMPSTD